MKLLRSIAFEINFLLIDSEYYLTLNLYRIIYPLAAWKNDPLTTSVRAKIAETLFSDQHFPDLVLLKSLIGIQLWPILRPWSPHHNLSAHKKCFTYLFLTFCMASLAVLTLYLSIKVYIEDSSTCRRKYASTLLLATVAYLKSSEGLRSWSRTTERN